MSSPSTYQAVVAIGGFYSRPGSGEVAFPIAAVVFIGRSNFWAPDERPD